MSYWAEAFLSHLAYCCGWNSCRPTTSTWRLLSSWIAHFIRWAPSAYPALALLPPFSVWSQPRMLNELTRNAVGPLTVETTGTGLAPISPYSSDFLSVPATASAVPPSSTPRTRVTTDHARRRVRKTVG